MVIWVTSNVDHKLFSRFVIDVLVEVTLFDTVTLDWHATDSIVGYDCRTQLCRSEHEIADVVVMFTEALIGPQFSNLNQLVFYLTAIFQLILVGIFVKDAVVFLSDFFLRYKHRHVSHYSYSALRYKVNILRLFVLPYYESALLKETYIRFARQYQEHRRIQLIEECQ